MKTFVLNRTFITLIAMFCLLIGHAYGASISVDTLGRVGIGTSVPASELEVKGKIRSNYGDGNYDVWIQGGAAGGEERNLALLGMSETNGDRLHLNYNGEYQGGTRITGEVEIMSGNVGIGTTAPTSLLHLSTSTTGIAGGLVIENTAYGAKTQICSSIYGIPLTQFFVNDNQVLVLNRSGNAYLTGGLYQNSDSSLKENVNILDNSLEKVTQLRGVCYEWKDKEERGDKLHIGLIAQEVEKVFPEAVSVDNKGNKSIAYSNLVAPLIEAVKELKSENESQGNEITVLKNEIADLKSAIAAIQAAIKK